MLADSKSRGTWYHGALPPSASAKQPFATNQKINYRKKTDSIPAQIGVLTIKRLEPHMQRLERRDPDPSPGSPIIGSCLSSVAFGCENGMLKKPIPHPSPTVCQRLILSVH